MDRLRCDVAMKGGLASALGARHDHHHHRPRSRQVRLSDPRRRRRRSRGAEAPAAAADLLAFFERLAPCIVAMEACSSAHHWARELVALGHDVRLIPPQYAKPYVKRNKTDAADAEAICEAVGRPTMRFVPIKTKESQALLALHRVRSLLVRQRTAAVNSARGLLGEFGLVAPKGIRRVGELRRSMEEASEKRPAPRGARGSHGPVRSPRRTDREARHGRGGRSLPGTRPARKASVSRPRRAWGR